MSPDRAVAATPASQMRSWLPIVLLLGLYLTLRGYHSFDGDQAYRLPLLLHRQDPSLYADDPFVRSFDAFNPHRGSLALLDTVSRPFGLPGALFLVFVATFVATCRSVARLTAAAWPDLGPSTGWVAVGLFLAAKAGNIGTNHLFEAMVLDRLVALALGWLAIADAVTHKAGRWWMSAIWIGAATVVHPSVGLQLAIVLGTNWLAWAVLARITMLPFRTALLAVGALAVAVLPGLIINLPQATTLSGDLPAPLFRILSVELQSPQHMLPHLWRMPQWLAWFSYLAIALLQLGGWRPTHGNATAGQVHRDADSDDTAPKRNPSRIRLTIMMGAIAVGLTAAWFAIEIRQDIRVTVFQPFRMSTVIRGLALVLVSGRLVSLWRAGDALSGLRATVLATGFLGDWLLVVATFAELTVSAMETVRRAVGPAIVPRWTPWVTYIPAIALGLNFLAHHDTEYGHIPLLVSLGVGLAIGAIRSRAGFFSRLADVPDSRRRIRLATAIGIAWIVPCGALLAAMIPPGQKASSLPLVRSLVDRCRFVATPLDDIERLALWCREHTSLSARFIGPPGPKTFRLWSRRNLAFSRAGSPYHGAGLADWFSRFADHVDFRGTPEEFVRAYRDHRHEFEARYDALSDAQRAALAIRQGADYIIAAAPGETTQIPPTASLELLHIEGRYAVYRLDPSVLVHRQP